MSKLLRGLLIGASLLSAPSLALAKANPSQARLDAFAQSLGYHLTITSNKATDGCPDKPVRQLCFSADLDLTLPKVLPQGDWAIYAGFVETLLPPRSDAFDMVHVNGDLYRLTPKAGVVLKPGATYKVGLVAPGHIFSPYFMMPNAYVTSGSLKPRVIASSRTAIDAGSGQETLPFVTPFSDEAALGTQAPDDMTRWLTPERLFDQTQARQSSIAAPEFIILPTPVEARHLSGPALDLAKGVRLSLDGVKRDDIQAALKALKQAGVPESPAGIHLNIGLLSGAVPGAYDISAQASGIVIHAADAAGASYALRSLAQQAAFEHGRPKPLEVHDAPRFQFRGMHLDLARNFQSKAQILKVIETMAQYKLNKLHLHLGDDEGWRLAIDGLPELTDIGSKRCHDLKEDTCLLPQLGAGPDNAPGINGFLTRADYIDILKAARARQIEVIPSFDMPGHSRAAVRAMEARYRHMMAAGKTAEATQYRLQDPADTTVYDSIQHYNDNTLNICIPSTYAFIDKVMESIKAMHDEAGLPLKIYHIGTDETAGAWKDSPACKALMAEKSLTVPQLGSLFITRVSDLLGSKGIEPAGWSDGMGSVDPAQMPKKVQSNSWGGLFGGGAADAYRQANQGWDVVMSTPDVLYLDMPNAPDGVERGYDWASRTTDLYKVFAFLPENLGANASVMLDNHAKGGTIADPKPLDTGHHIAGMQGQLWSETIRSDAIADYMLYPRALAVAERAWHKGDWEPAYVPGKSYSYADGNVDTAKLLADWQGFQARLVPQLAWLDAHGVRYRVPVPGARISDGKLEINSPVVGMSVQYRIAGDTWKTYSKPLAVKGNIRVRTVSADGKRFSRETMVK